MATLSPLLSLLRPKQWVKNAFVCAPLIFVGGFTDMALVLKTLTAVLLFCVASSAAYVINDLHDIPYDRNHHVKSKTRPLASGAISVKQALCVLCILYALVIAGGIQYPKVGAVLVIYLLLNIAYTWFLKHQPVIDIFVIATGFVLRVYAGAQALSVPVSEWMFVTTFCLALYLAAIKRRQELLYGNATGREVLQYYSVALVNRYAEMAATGALVFYSLFVMSMRTELIMTIPVVLYGLYRYWFVVEVLEHGESPTDALFKDWQLCATVLIWGALCVIGIYRSGIPH